MSDGGRLGGRGRSDVAGQEEAALAVDGGRRLAGPAAAGGLCQHGQAPSNGHASTKGLGVHLDELHGVGAAESSPQAEPNDRVIDRAEPHRGEAPLPARDW